MKRKLLDAALVVLGATLFMKLFLWLPFVTLRLPSDFQRLINALMLLSGGFALSLGLFLLVPRIVSSQRLSPSLRTPVKIAAALVGGWLLAALVFFVYGFVSGIVHSHSSRTPQPPQVTWDDQKK